MTPSTKATTSGKEQFFQNINNLSITAFKILPRQALHARTIGFKHPRTGEYLSFTAELPEDMQQVIDKWRNYAIHQKNKL